MAQAIVAIQSLVDTLLSKIKTTLYVLQRDIHQTRNSETKFSQIADWNAQLSLAASVTLAPCRTIAPSTSSSARCLTDSGMLDERTAGLLGIMNQADRVRHRRF
jgi:hypothetical protein